MATPKKKWPHEADWARVDSIALARTGRTLLVEMVDEVNDATVLRRIVRAVDIYREIEAKLQAVGAKEVKKEQKPESNQPV